LSVRAQPIFIGGPTAVGKSAVAIELAGMLGAEILSADSMQVYRGMDIGTAKIKGQHLVDICDITEHFDVKQYVALAGDLLARLHRVIVCGGTGLYIRALRQGLFEGPGRDPALRARLEAMPASELFVELQRLDPKAASSIDRRNPRRLIRALEVVCATGKSIRDFQTQTSATGVVFCLNRDRHDLYARIQRRVDEQMAAGWLDEVRQLLERGLAGNPTAMQAAGYRELAAHLAGKLSLPEAVALVKTRTRQLARRQLTWFRREPGVIWIDVKPEEPPTETAGRIVRHIEDV
jgi:tRNA dimethylallyltransferase